MPAAKCPECGYRLSGDETICPRCLTVLDGSAASPSLTDKTGRAAATIPPPERTAGPFPSLSTETGAASPSAKPAQPKPSAHTAAHQATHAAASSVSPIYLGLSIGLGVLTLIAFVVLWKAVTQRNAAYYLAQAEGYRQNGQYEHALVAYLRVLERDPNSTAAYLGSGQCYLEMKRPSEAIPHFRRALDIDNKLIAARRGLGIAYAQVGMYPEAESNLKPAWEARDIEAGTYLGYVYHQEQRYDEAITLLNQVTAAQPTNALAQEMLGRSLYAAGRYDEALQPLRTAVEQNPNSATAREALGLVGYQLGRCDWALEQFNVLIAANPQRADWYAYVGQCLLREGEIQEATAYLHHARVLGQADLTLYGTHLALAQACLKQSRYEEAIVFFQQALILSPESAEAMAGLGQAYVAQGRCDVAKPLFQQALNRDPYVKAARQGLEQCP